MIEIHFDGQLVGYCDDVIVQQEQPYIESSGLGHKVIGTKREAIDLTNVRGVN